MEIGATIYNYFEVISITNNDDRAPFPSQEHPRVWCCYYLFRIENKNTVKLITTFLFRISLFVYLMSLWWFYVVNTFYLRVYCVGHMVKEYSEIERGNPLPPLYGLFLIRSKNSSIDMIVHTTAFATPVVEHWLERYISMSFMFNVQ